MRGCGIRERLALLAAMATLAAAAAVEEYRLKAAFLFNFTQFVSWPASAPALVIAVYGSEEVAAALEEAVQGKLVSGHGVSVRRARFARDALPCAMLFVATRDRREVAEALAAVRGEPVLTVGEGDDFLQRGGMIALVVRERRMRFTVDHATVRRSGLRISSRLLSLAEQVRE